MRPVPPVLVPTPLAVPVPAAPMAATDAWRNGWPGFVPVPAKNAIATTAALNSDYAMLESASPTGQDDFSNILMAASHKCELIVSYGLSVVRDGVRFEFHLIALATRSIWSLISAAPKQTSQVNRFHCRIGHRT